MLGDIRYKILKKKTKKRDMELYEITMDQLFQKQEDGAEIIDVRSSQEYNEGHLDGAINIPYYEINSNIYRILPDKDKEIVVYCSAGIRGKRAYKTLTKLKYKNVYNLYGGLENWI